MSPQNNSTGIVTVFGYVKKITGCPIPGAEIRIRINPSPQYSEANIISKDDFLLLSDEEGYFELSLIGGLKITVIIPDCNYQITGVLPPNGRIELTQIDKQATLL